MIEFSTATTLALDPTKAAEALCATIEPALGGPDRVGGAFLCSTAATGSQALEIGRLLDARWPEASLMGTSFEGVLAEGQAFRDRPATVLFAWAHGPGEPIPFCLEADDADGAPLVHDLEEALGRERLEPDDLLLLFPDAMASVGLEARLADLLRPLGTPSVAGAAASGVLGAEALAWVADAAHPAATLGLVLPGVASSGANRVECAGASRFASPWLEIGACRDRWIDELDGEPPLDWVRRQLGLDDADPVEPYLDRLLVRLRDRNVADEENWESAHQEDQAVFVERYVIGLDERTGAISVPGDFRRGDRLALALPDPQRARERLRVAVEALPPSPMLAHFACRARDEALYGDADIESALVAHDARGRETIGTLAPFQIASDREGACRMLVHSTVLAAVGAA